MLGIPEDDRGELLDWLDEGVEAESGSVFSPDSMRRIRAYGTELIAEKRANPDGGIMSTIVHARYDDDGSQLSERELVDFFSLLFPAGAETTRNAISTGVLTFAAQPEDWTRFREGPEVGRHRSRRDPALGHAVQVQAPHGRDRLRIRRQSAAGRSEADLLGDVRQP